MEVKNDATFFLTSEYCAIAKQCNSSTNGKMHALPAEGLKFNPDIGSCEMGSHAEDLS